MNQLTDKKLIVTGAAGALGEAVARTANAAGAEVVLLDIIDGFSSSLGPVHVVDLMDPDAVDACFDEIGSFDAIANIAGGFDMGPAVHETEDAFWDRMFDVNVRTLRNILRAAVPFLVAQGHGSIINVGALSAERGIGNMGAYTAAKSTVMRLTEALSDEVKARHCHINLNKARFDRGNAGIKPHLSQGSILPSP